MAAHPTFVETKSNLDTGSAAISDGPAWLAAGVPKKLTKVLLLDGYSTRTLACVRSWGKKSIPFAVGGETHWDMSLFSRYAKEKFVYTSPKRNLSQFIEDVNKYCRRFGADCVFPTSEAAIMACSAYRDALECFPIIPREREIQSAFSKANTLGVAESVGITVPRTFFLSDNNWQSIDPSLLNFPLVVKSETSEVMLATRVTTSSKTVVVVSGDELVRECEKRFAARQRVLVQEFIDGYGIGVSGLFDEGRPVAVIGHRRLRESTPWGGPSALAETIEIDAQLMDATRALMKKIGFTGPAMAEYKVDRRTGRPYLMEINGRFWGSVLLAIAAGQDLPYLYWKMLRGIEIRPEETVYRIGVRGRYLVGDTKCLLLSLRGKPKSWPGQIASPGLALRSYLSSFLNRHTTELILTRDDPKPFIGRLMRPGF